MPAPFALQPRYALFQTYRDEPDAGWIKVVLEPFEFMGHTFQTEMRLDHIEGLDERLQAVAGARLTFPTAPEAGGIDGSIYFYGRHHTVDVHELEFELHDGSRVPLTVRGRVVLAGHPDVPPFPVDMRTIIRLPLTAEQMASSVDVAIREVGATSPRQLGQVMAQVRPGLLYEGEAALAAAVASRLLGRAT